MEPPSGVTVVSSVLFWDRRRAWEGREDKACVGVGTVVASTTIACSPRGAMWGGTEVLKAY